MSDLLIKAMTYAYPEKLPVSVGVLPKAWFDRYDDFALLSKEYPNLMPAAPNVEELRANLSYSYRAGEWVDEWGCVWENLEEGMEGIVKRHPLPEREMIWDLQIPTQREGRLPHGLMYLRLLDLRGFEEAMLDFAEECEELQVLIDKMLAYNLIQLDVVLPRMKKGEILYLGDDLGMQNGLAIGPEKWRKYMGPCFKAMYEKIKASGQYVYMHTDGMIWEIMPDLHACGADMINPQFRANGLDNLKRVCKGKIPINLDLDRQLFPFATPAQLDDHVRQCVEEMYLPQGGLGLNIEFNYEVPLVNAGAILEAASKYRHYKG